MEVQQNFYSNPAFCQQSEFLNGRPPRALSPRGSIRQSPVGAQTLPKILDTSIGERPNYLQEEGLQEQEFYEEVVVDDEGFITDKKFVIVAQNNEGKKYIQVPQDGEKHDYVVRSEERPESRYGSIQDDIASKNPNCYSVTHQLRARETKLTRSQSNRYEYIQMKEKIGGRVVSPRTSPQKKIYREDINIAQGRVQRYAVVDAEEETELAAKSARYALVPVKQLPAIIAQNPALIPNHSENRYDYKHEPQKLSSSQSPNRYNCYETSPSKNPSIFEYPQQSPRVGNPIATQKLHELLSTPKKTASPQRRFLTPQPKRRTTPPSTLSQLSRESFRCSGPPKQPLRAQQKLNYALSPKQLISPEKRHTAIVTPICSSPIQSVYSETTYSNKSASWMNLSVKKDSVQITLTIAATFMLVCGSINSALCFYMISKEFRRQYFLDFGIISGFTCIILGILGCRTRNVYWLPNRNYISGR